MLKADEPMAQLYRRKGLEEAARRDWEWIDRTRKDRYPY